MTKWQTRAVRVVVLAVALLAAMACVGGCQRNGYSKFFVSSFGGSHPKLEDYAKENLVAYSGDPRIIREKPSEDLFRRLAEQGYCLLGQSNFWATAQSEKGLKRQARKLGAELVVASSEYRGSESGAYPITSTVPQTTYHSGTAYSGRYYGTWSGTSTTYQTQTTMIPYTIYYYDYQTSFWTRRLQPPVFGAFCIDLSAEERKLLGKNGGAKVAACVMDSPAWKADLLPGDIILQLDGEDVPGAKGLYDRTLLLHGQTVHVTYLRQTSRQTVTVQLNPLSDNYRSPAPAE
jgi:hypothetical protein